MATKATKKQISDLYTTVNVLNQSQQKKDALIKYLTIAVVGIIVVVLIFVIIKKRRK